MIMSYQRIHLLQFIFLVLVTLSASVTAQPSFCSGNYNSTSTYQSNLRTLLSNLYANVDQNGFYNASVGESTTRANAVVLCRGDVDLETCRSCVNYAAVELVQECLNRTQGVLWYDSCMVRYSDTPTLGTMDTAPANYMANPHNTTRPDTFRSDLGFLLYNISSQASTGGSLMKVASGNISTVGLQTIYALEQCTPDLSAEDCLSCLRIAAELLDSEGTMPIGARLLLPSCNLRYEVRIFYNETRLLELPFVPMPTPAMPPPAVPPSAVVPMPTPAMPPPAVPPSAVPPRAEPLEQGNRGNHGNNTTRTIIITVTSTVLIILIFIGFLIRRRNQKKPKDEGEMDAVSTMESLQYEFSVIQEATNNFSESNKIGQGGFGVVYKGKLSNGKEIAVKRLSLGSAQGDLEFKNEVMLLAKLQHRNLVRLFGFSIQGQEKLLIYEFVQNASLDQFLFDQAKCSQLDWSRRNKIIAGIARGILYMHEDSRLKIIHRDLKASNVLLDREMNPKIADFGMARIFVPDETQGSTSRIVGTYGYMAPEYATRGHFSVKSDIFSFGVILLEIISGLKNNCSRSGDTKGDLINSAWGNWLTGTSANLVDPVLRVGSNIIPRDIFRCIHIGLLCIQENAAQRPTMATILTVLNNYSINLPMPSPPAFFVQGGYSESSLPLETGGSSDRRRSENGGNGSGDTISKNEMSISEFVAR